MKFIKIPINGFKVNYRCINYANGGEACGKFDGWLKM